MERFPSFQDTSQGGSTGQNSPESLRPPAGSDSARPYPSAARTAPRTALNRVPSSNSTTTRPTAARTPSIRIRRLPSSSAINQLPQINEPGTSDVARSGSIGRRRSGSAPQRLQVQQVRPRQELERQATVTEQLPPVSEESSRPQQFLQPEPQPVQTGVGGRLRSASNATRRSVAGSLRRRRSNSLTSSNQGEQDNEYDNHIVDMLDVVDPEVSTITTLTNVQNSLFLPDLGRWLNRRPTYELTHRPTDRTQTQTQTQTVDFAKPLPTIPEPLTTTTTTTTRVGAPTTTRTTTGTAPLTPYVTAQEKEDQHIVDREEMAAQMHQRSNSITSVLTESHYAVLPHGATLEGWSEEDKDLLNDYVRHLMHSRRAKFKRSMKGFGKYIKRPVGFFITLYAVLITLFGFAWVLFLIGWVNLGNRRNYIINVIDNVLVALFAVMGDGLAPFRIVDTYHMIYIAHYHQLSWRLRREAQLPELHDHNDLPEVPLTDVDIETAREEAEKHEFSVLKPYQQQKLMHHQAKFSRSHTFYKPHETNTHYAFPLRLLITVVVLLDCHSLFQIALGTCTWAISYHVRPTSLTTVILCCSICCNIAAGIVITVGDRRTRKKEVVEKMLRQSLTEDAMKHLKKKGVVPGVVGITGENGEQSTWSKPIENRGQGEGEEFVMWPRAEDNNRIEEEEVMEKRE